VIFAADPKLEQTIPQEIAQIVHQHPARVILLRTDPHQPDRAIEAHVTALCQKVSGGRQVCSESITVEAAAGALRRLPYTVRSLLLGDLPTALWWATQQSPPLAGELFAELANMSDQVIYESQAWTDPVQGMVATADWALAGPSDLAVADLEWKRIKYYRRIMSQNLDPAVEPGALDNLTEVRVTHGPHALPKAWLMIGWAASRLGWQPQGGKVQVDHEIAWKFRAGSRAVQGVAIRDASAEPYKVHEVKVSWQTAGKTRSMTCTRMAPGQLAVQTDDPTQPKRLQVVPSQGRPSLVARQLPKLGRDSLFLEALAVARDMAATLRS
jgi:glucose-6-phosphate dehydrogenase assembly protein OpcA